MWLSLRVAAIATLISVVLGLGIAYVLANYDFRGKELLDAIITLPIVLPPTVLGYYLLVMLGRQSFLGRLHESFWGAPLVFTWQAAVIAATFHSLPLLAKSARAAFESTERTFEDAARTLGAPEWRVFLRITLPLARRSILAASVFAFARALGDFGVTIMIAGNIPGRTQTMAVAIFDAVESGNGRLARVLVIVISAVAGLVLYAVNRLNRLGDARP